MMLLRIFLACTMLALLVAQSFATVTEIGPFDYPDPSGLKADVSNSHTLDATTDRTAVIFTAPKTGNISAIGYTVRTVTSSQSVDARIETVDGTTGFPSGTLIDSPTNSAYSSQSPVAASTYYEPSLTAAQAVTKGNTYAVVFQFTSTAGTIQMLVMDQGNAGLNLPYGAFNSTGSYAKVTARAVSVVLKYDDGNYYSVGLPPPVGVTGTVSKAYNSGSSPDEYGIRFTPTVTMTVNGWWGGFYMANGGTADVVLYDSDQTTVITKTSLDGDNNGQATTNGYTRGFFESDATLTAGLTYYLVLKPTNTTNVTLMHLTFPNTGIMAMLSGGATTSECYRVDAAGSWNVTGTTVRPWLGFRVTGITQTGGSHVIGQ